MQGPEFICALLALQAWRDGREEGISGMLGVAFVIRNRIRAGWWGGDWLQILAHHKEWAATEKPYSDELPDPRNFAFRAILQEVNGIFSGARVDDILVTVTNSILSVPPPPALYYGRINDDLRPWFLESISRNHDQHKIVAQIGLLHFWT